MWYAAIHAIHTPTNHYEKGFRDGFDNLNPTDEDPNYVQGYADGQESLQWAKIIT